MSTPTAQRPSTVGAIQVASMHGNPMRSADGCRDCIKSGLAILPVISTVLPNSLKRANAEVSALERLLDATDLKAHWYAMRTLPTGYLYVLKPDLTWDAYVVDAEGLLRQMPPATAPASPGELQPMSQACKRSGDNIPAQVIAIDPTKHASVWLAFSRYRWTPDVLKAYAANKHNCRDQRMTKLDVMAAAAGSLGAGSKAANAVRFGVTMSAAVGQYVADYSSAATRDMLNKHLAVPLQARGEQSAALARKMAEISRETQAKAGAVILLRDDLGVAMDLNAMRNAETGRLGAYLTENQRKRFVGETIMGLEKAFTENGQAAEWAKRYKKKYRAQAIVDDRKSFDDKVKPWERRINDMSDDVATLNGGAGVKAAWFDFDPNDDHSSIDRQRATAAVLHGAVKTQAEQALWDRWFAEAPNDPYATLWGAVTAMDTSLGDYLVGKRLPDAGKTDKFVDILKSIRAAVGDFRDRLAKRAAEDSLALVGVAMTSQVARLKTANPALYRVAGMRVLIVASVRTTVTATPVFMSVTQTQQTMLLAEAAFGAPTAAAKRLLDIEMRTSQRVYVVGSNGVDAYAAASTRTTTEKLRVVELWLPESVAKQMPTLVGPGARPALLPPGVNPYKALMEFTRSSAGGLAWMGMTLQALNLGNATKDYADGAVADKTDAAFGIVSGILGVSGAMAEIAAGAMSKMSERFGKRLVERVAFGGGVLASLSALAEAIQAGVKSARAISAGDVDAALWYAGSSVAFFLSGIAGLGGALAGASAAGALTGTLGILAPIGAAAACIPVWGWIAIGVFALGMGLMMLWQAIRNTDTPLEIWLLGCVYGSGDNRLTVREEMESLNDVMYAMTIEVEWTDDAIEWRNTEFYDDYDNFRFAISLPGAGPNSMIDCKVVLIGRGGRNQVFHETIRPRMSGNIPVDPKMPVWSAAPANARSAQPKFIWWESPRITDGGKRYGGQLKVDDSLYSQAEVEIQYWPDQASMPSFVLPKRIDQRTLAAED